MAGKLKIKTGDTVVVLSGREKGKSGEVIRVIPKQNRVLVRDVNMVKRHAKPTPTHPGGLIEKEAPLHVSNVALTDPKDNKPTRVGYRVLEDGRKVRFARRSGEVIDR